MIKTALVPNTSASLRTTFRAEANLAEGQCLLEAQILSKEKCYITRRSST